MRKSLFLLFAIVSIAGMIAISGCNKPETYTVTFNANGGAGTMVSQSFTEGEAQLLTRNAFTREGYSFAAWNTVADGTGTSYNDGQSITVTADITLYAQWTSNGTNPTPASTNILDGHEFVDLGLQSGTKWATCNVGAETPEAYGSYFAWGETAHKENYTWGTYGYCNGSRETLTKYCCDSNYGNEGFTDNLTVLVGSDDAASVLWSSAWRMPTKDELNELFSCTHEWVTQNGVNGRKFTGPNGNSIFLPAAGNHEGSDLDNAGAYGLYWASSLSADYPYCAWYLYFGANGYSMNDDGVRYYGYSVRPVCAQ